MTYAVEMPRAQNLGRTGPRGLLDVSNNSLLDTGASESGSRADDSNTVCPEPTGPRVKNSGCPDATFGAKWYSTTRDKRLPESGSSPDAFGMRITVDACTAVLTPKRTGPVISFSRSLNLFHQ